MNRRAETECSSSSAGVSVFVNLDGTGVSDIDTGIGFFDHMLEQLSRHSLIDIRIKVKDSLNRDYYRTVEDVGLVLGGYINKALGDRKGIVRYGFFLLPMDEALCEAVIDLSAAPCLVFVSPMKHMKVRDFDVKLMEVFFRAFSEEGSMSIHLRQICGDEVHHVCEGLMKAFARALRVAAAPDLIAYPSDGMEIKTETNNRE